jgi:hypothetical protein
MRLRNTPVTSTVVEFAGVALSVTVSRNTAWSSTSGSTLVCVNAVAAAAGEFTVGGVTLVLLTSAHEWKYGPIPPVGVTVTVDVTTVLLVLLP